MNAPFRAAVFGGRFSTCLGAPLAGPGSSTTRNPSSSSSLSPSPSIASAPPHSGGDGKMCTSRRLWTVSRHSYHEQKKPISSTKATCLSAPRCHNNASSSITSSVQPRSRSMITRMASSSSSSSSSASSHGEQQKRSSSSSSSSSSAASSAPLDWTTFFNLRASRRRYTLISSILASVGTTSAGVTALATQDLETIGAQLMGLDPIVVMVLGTASCGAMGWLAGPFLGNSVWRLIHRKYKDAFAIVSIPFFESPSTFALRHSVAFSYASSGADFSS